MDLPLMYIRTKCQMAPTSETVAAHISPVKPIDKQDISSVITSLEKSNLNETATVSLVDTSATLSKVIDTLIDLPTRPPSLYVDLEGVRLSRQGTISILQLYILPQDRTYLIDIHVLGEEAFLTASNKGHTLKAILESEAIPKVFFDVRNDSDALYSHFQINLAGIHDVQLMELATRTFSRRLVNGLSKCIEREAPMTIAEKLAWKAAKEKGLKLFAPERGGSYQVFNIRPLPEEIREYCVQDVQFLPKLWTNYDRKMTITWREKVEKAVKERVTLSQGQDYNGHGRHMALAPAGWA